MAAAIRVVSLPAYRACDLCLHCESRAAGRACGAPAVLEVSGATPPSIEAARAGNGPCGPDADHLDMAAWA